MAASVVSVGGKGSSLSSSSVYAVANAISNVEIGSSVIEKLSQAQSRRPSHLDFSITKPSTPDRSFLTLEESRASLFILLNKLLLADSGIRPDLPLLIQKTLNEAPQNLDFASVFGNVLRVSKDEKSVLEASSPDLNGILALIDCSSSALVPVLDSVAALSCEVINADVKAFDSPVSGDGFAVKDETDAASDMRDLLFGSKFVGRNSTDAVVEIPEAHGSFRSIARSVHARARVELNSKASGKGKALVVTLLPLAMAIRLVGEISFRRVKLNVDQIDDDKLKVEVRGLFEKNCCHCFEEIRNGFQSISAKSDSELEFLAVLHQIYGFLGKLRIILAWEAAVALYVLQLNDELNGKTQMDGGLTGVYKNAGKKDEKKMTEKKQTKKKKVLGRGTSVIRQFFNDRLYNDSRTSYDNPVILVEFASKLSSLFDPKDPGLDSLLSKVKEIVESNEVRRLPKIPKGTRDFGKEQMAIRERAFSIIVGVFKRHGGVALDTPVFELRETLMGKYGEDSKLIYDLADQGGEICSLRYDLTVPFARYLAMNKINALKRYQIAKVYRRDNPSKGRYREFYQCDFDIAGNFGVMEPDFEVIKVLTELLDELNIGEYKIKLNHRKLLDGMLNICGVPSEKFRTICSSIDKLDKQSFEQVKDEMVKEKGLSVEVADKIGSYVIKRGRPLKVLCDLKQEGSQFLEDEKSVIALKELEILFGALEKSKCIDKVAFDLSLARGLDYYTGVIFEAVFRGSTQVGSIAAGGRYDNLVAMFGSKDEVPAVGVSLGIERVFTIMEEQLAKDNNQVIRAAETLVLVVFVGKKGEELVGPAAELVSELWKVKIPAEFAVTNKVMKQIDRAKQSGIPFMVIVGETELRDGVANLKEIAINKEEPVQREQLVEELQRRLNATDQSFSNRLI